MWPWWEMIPIEVDGSYQLMEVINWRKLSNDGSYQLMEIINWRKLSTDGSYQLMEVLNWWKLSTEGSYQLVEVINWWKLSTDGSYQLMEVINLWKLSTDGSYSLTDWLTHSLSSLLEKKVVWCKNVLLAPLCDLIADQRMYIISMELTVDIQHQLKFTPNIRYQR